MREIVAGALFDRTGAGADHPPIGQNDFQRQHIVPGGAVLHRADARGVVGQHPADAGIGARVRREEKPVAGQHLVHILVKHARLHRHLKIPVVDGEDIVHPAEINHQAALHGDGIALDAGARTPGRHRHPDIVGQPQRLADLRGAQRPDHRVGQMGLVCGLVPGVLLADAAGQADAVGGINGLQLGDEGVGQAHRALSVGDDGLMDAASIPIARGVSQEKTRKERCPEWFPKHRPL